MIEGNPETALKAPYSIVLTEQSAKKLFGNEKALGKAIRFDTLEYQVTGVMKDIPRFSHLRFEALASFSTIELQKQNDPRFSSWGSMWLNYVYFLLPENSSPAEIQTYLDAIAKEENAVNEHVQRKLGLQPMGEIALGEELSNEIGPTMSISMVWVVGALSLVVILSACFNYTNLSIARSIRRFKEVGLRKAVGAARGQVRQQFMYEAIIVSLSALLISFFIFLILRDQFLGMDNDLQEIATLELTPVMIGTFVAFSIVVGVIAGTVPALFLARINIVHALKDASSVKVFKRVTFRRGLVLLQYTITLMFITATIIGYFQYKAFLTFDLGFETENILNIRLNGNKPEILMKEFNELPEVQGASVSMIVSNLGNHSGRFVKYKDENDSTVVWYNAIDAGYVPLHNHTFIAGGNFIARPETKKANVEVIVNESFIKHFQIAGNDPLNAVGEEVLINGSKHRIVGVLKDFHYSRMDQPIKPVLFTYYLNDGGGFLNLKISTADPVATMSRIEAIWKKHDRIHTLDATFYDDAIRHAYGEISVMIKTIGFLAFLSISIASMGLFGMVVFTTETRLKEIGIRKVLGASAGNLTFLLSRSFVILIAISAVIALPATYLFFDKVVLTGFPYHPPIGAVELVAGLGMVLLIAFIMIGSQTLRAARSSPVDVLKSE